MDDPVFRGCTRPALLLGVPLLPMVAAFTPIALVTCWAAFAIGIYAWIWSLALTSPLILVFRRMTAIDDQRLLQMLLRVCTLGSHLRACKRPARLYCASTPTGRADPP